MFEYVSLKICKFNQPGNLSGFFTWIFNIRMINIFENQLTIYSYKE